MKKILTIVGARPQFVKAAIVSKAIAENSNLTEVLVHTGQHYDSKMSDIFFKDLGIKEPQYNLGIGSASHGEQTGKMMIALEEVMIKEKPEWVLIYGDTNSTIAGSLVASKLHIPIAHVEAGLRSYNRKMPEEINRVVSDHLSEILFAPTNAAVSNLLKEGISQTKIQHVGDVMYDASLLFGDKFNGKLEFDLPKNFVLATVHRAENTDNKKRMSAIVEALNALSNQFKFILPLHPRTKNKMKDWNLEFSANVICIEPVGYLEMLHLEKSSDFIVTDSGGVQKEAYFFHKKCITLREETEWVELVQFGWNHLCSPTSSSAIIKSIQEIDLSAPAYKECYGKGDASVKIAKALA